MKTSSPLRYPGGKSAMASLLAQIRNANRLGNRDLAEPFAGGAGASLTLLYLEETPTILINDIDRAIHDFWWAILNNTDKFINLLENTCVNITEWRRHLEIYRSKKPISKLKRGFSTFFLNRCNRSGIIMNGGPIGGIKQNGMWKIDARFNKMELSARCRKVAEFKDRIILSNEDGIEFIKINYRDDIMYFIDPPYFEKGKTLYMNTLKPSYHQSLADQLRSMSDAAWILTYDDCPEVRRMYQNWATIRPFSLRYAASERRNGSEILIAPKWMRLPASQNSAAIQW